MNAVPSLLVRLLLTTALCSFIIACTDEQRAAAPYPNAPFTLTFDWGTHRRLAPGSDNWATTWALDGTQFTVWGDGGGFGGTNSMGRVSLGVAQLHGRPEQLRARNIYGGVDAVAQSTIDGKSYGIIDINGRLYMWVSPGSGARNFESQTLYYSDDQGESWQANDWSFDRADGLVHPTFCQFGRSMSEAPDDYVYMYAVEIEDGDDLVIQMPGRLALIRTPQDALLEREAYEFFAGVEEGAEPAWSTALSDRRPVLEDPNGIGWNSSATFNPDLGAYLILTEHTESAKANLSVFSSQDPWGPWSTVYYGTFGKGRIPPTVFYYNLPSAWLTGNDFVLVFTGVRENDSWNSVGGRFTRREAR